MIHPALVIKKMTSFFINRYFKQLPKISQPERNSTTRTSSSFDDYEKQQIRNKLISQTLKK